MTSDFGPPELKRHCSLEIEPRAVSGGGNVITVGYRNTTPDLLERLYRGGFLKALWERQSQADRRVSNGRAFQELYAMWHTRGKEPAAAETEYRVSVTLEGHIGSERDIAETVYNRTLAIMGNEGKIARAVCIEGAVWALSDSMLRKTLDKLPQAVEQARREVLEALEKIR
jgi:hypothetical protein